VFWIFNFSERACPVGKVRTSCSSSCELCVFGGAQVCDRRCRCQRMAVYCTGLRDVLHAYPVESMERC